MRLTRILFLLMLACFATQHGWGANGLTIDDVLKLRRHVALSLSADGSLLAYLIEEPNDEQHSKLPVRTTLWIQEARGGQAREYTPGEGRASSPRWSSDGKTLAFLFAPHGGPAQLHLVTPGTLGAPRRLTEHPTSIQDFRWAPDGLKIAFTTIAPPTPEEQRRADLGYDEIEVAPGPDQAPPERRLWVVAVKDGVARPIESDGTHVLALDWAPDGRRLLLTIADHPYSDEEQLRPHLMVIDAGGGKPEDYCKTRGKLTSATWAPDGRSVAFLGTTENFTDPYPGALFVCSQGSAPKNIAGDSSFTIEGYRWLPNGQAVLAVIAEGAHRAFARIELADARVERLTKPPLEVAFRSPWAATQDGEKIVGVLSSWNRPPDIWLVERGSPPRKLTNANAYLAARSFGESSELRWRARDGLEITGVLIKPVDFRAGRRYPLVVQVHGSQVGDMNEFQASWMNWGQLLAANGYLVLLPNYRGSLTSGPHFARADQGDLGGKDLSDIMDGVDHLVKQGLADPEALGIGGVSYGGFLTALAVTQTPRFKAAVMGIGLSNWISMAGQTSGPESMVALYWLHSPYEDWKLLWDRSPVAHAQKARTPTLIYAGERDPNVPIAQSREFFRALRHYGVPSEFVLYPREGHSILEPNHLRDNLTRIVGWFDRYLKSGSPPEVHKDQGAR